MSTVDELLTAINADESVQVRRQLEPLLGELAALGPQLWVTAFNTRNTRFNKYLFLNAPELWVDVSGADWLSIMESSILRRYRPSDVFDTGRFDDLRLLHRYVRVDSFQMFFTGTNASPEDRDAVRQRALGFADLFLFDDDDQEIFDEGCVQVTKLELDRYREVLQTQLTWLKGAAESADAVRARVVEYASHLS